MFANEKIYICHYRHTLYIYALVIFRTILEHFCKTAPSVLKTIYVLNNYYLVP